MLLLNDESIRVSVPVIDRTIVALVDSVYYDQENEEVDVTYFFDEDFYCSDDVEWLNADRLRVFEKSLRNHVAVNLAKVIRRQEWLNERS